jgi:hypothetical protein
MNQAQVNQEWWAAMKREREGAMKETLRRLADERQRAMTWSRRAFPDRVEQGHACPFAAVLAIEAVRRRPDENPSRGQIEKKLLALVKRRGDVLDPWWSRVSDREETAA